MGLLDNFVASINGLTPDQAATVPSGQQAPFTANAIGGALDSFGQAQGGVSHVMFGIQARQAAQYQAQQYQQNAGQAEASAQRQAFSVNQQTQFVTSRALAVAAGSGAGASDPTVMNMIARDAGQGAYERSVALYQGADRARLDEEQAQAKDFEGETTFRNSALVGVAAAAGGAANLLRTTARGGSLFQRFGGGGPGMNDSGSSDITTG